MLASKGSERKCMHPVPTEREVKCGGHLFHTDDLDQIGSSLAC